MFSFGGKSEDNQNQMICLVYSFRKATPFVLLVCALSLPKAIINSNLIVKLISHVDKCGVVIF